jgi:hypothetical protein
VHDCTLVDGCVSCTCFWLLFRETWQPLGPQTMTEIAFRPCYANSVGASFAPKLYGMLLTSRVAAAFPIKETTQVLCHPPPKAPVMLLDMQRSCTPLFSILFDTFCLSNVGTLALELELDVGVGQHWRSPCLRAHASCKELVVRHDSTATISCCVMSCDHLSIRLVTTVLQPQETPIGRADGSQHVQFGATLHLQTPLNRLPRNAAIFFEFKHWKASKRKVRTIGCFCLRPIGS